jgi:hypothetical protein
VKQISLKILIFIFLAMPAVLSALTYTLAWSDETQHKTTEFAGITTFEEQDLFADLIITKTVIFMAKPDELYDPLSTENIISNIQAEKNTENGSAAPEEEEPAEGPAAEESAAPEEEEPSEEPAEEETAAPEESAAPEEENLTEDETTVTDEEYIGVSVLAAASDAYEFTIILPGIGDGTVMVGIGGADEEMVISGGLLTIFLQDGQSAVIKDLPVGTQYEVKETIPPGYIMSSENAEGFLPADGITVPVTNYYTGEESMKLIVKKIVTGVGADLDKAFRFIAFIGEEETTFTLKHDETLEFELPPGSLFTVAEDDYRNEGYYPKTVEDVYTDENGVIIVGITQINDYSEPDPPADPDPGDGDKEEPEAPAPDDQEEAGKKTSDPDTGDKNTIWVWYVLLAASSVALGILIDKGRKYN